jgi:hypothetical protein
MSGIELELHPVQPLPALQSARPSLNRWPASLSIHSAAKATLPVKLWRTVEFEVCVASGRLPNERRDAESLSSPAAPASPPTIASRCHRLRLLRPGVRLIGLLTAFLGLNAAAAEVQADRWRWSNPLPHGNNVMDMFVASDWAVQVGDGGSVYVQGLDERWAPMASGVSNYLRGVALMGDRLLIVGENGCILWSDDGNSFQPAQILPATANWFEGVAASAQRAVAVGDNGAIYTTTTGTNWSPSTSGTSEWLRGVAFGGGTFVAVGENGTILRSTSGTSWSRTTVGTAHLNRVRYLTTGGTGLFCIVGNSGVALTSSTGAAPWTSLNTGFTNNLFDVATNDTGLLVVGDQAVGFRAAGQATWTNHVTALPTNAPPAWVYLSASGVSNTWLIAGRTGLLLEGSRTNSAGPYTWQPSPDDSSHAWLWDVTIQRGIYVAVGDLATIQTSLDGILWAREVVPLPHTNVVLLGVGGTSNLLLAAGNAGNVLISRAGLTNLTITNYVGTNIVITNTVFDVFGLIWTNLPAFTTNTLQGVATGSNLFVISGDWGSIFTSPDGSNWTARATPTTNFLSGVASGTGGWIVVGKNGTLLRSGTDAVSWGAVPLATTNWLYRVRYVGGQFVVVGQNGAIYTSPDGTNWTSRASGTTRWLNDVTFLDGTWFVVGTQGLLLSSSNLLTWTSLPVPSVKSFYGATFQEGQLVLTGIEGIILRNQVVPRTTPVDILAYHRSVATNSAGTTNATVSAYELFLFGGQPDQFFQFQSCTNLASAPWNTNATLELFDPSGTIYLLRTRDLTNTPPKEFYRNRLVP